MLAAACWAGYILVNRVLGARLPGSQGPAAAAGLSALLYIPVGIWALASLGQSLEPADWLAIAAIVTANAVSVGTGGQARGPGQRRDPHEATTNDPGLHSAFPVQSCDALNMQPRRGDLEMSW